MRFSLLRLAVLSAPLFALTACGDGWETYRTTEVSPYGNERTAGSTVVYVRAKMMPKKELKLEPAVLSAEKIFTKAQEKGAPSPETEETVTPDSDVTEETRSEDILDTEPEAQQLPKEDDVTAVEEPKAGPAVTAPPPPKAPEPEATSMESDLSDIKTEAGDARIYPAPSGKTTLEQIYSDTF